MKAVFPGSFYGTWTDATSRTDETSKRRSVSFMVSNCSDAVLDSLRRAFVNSGFDQSIPKVTSSLNNRDYIRVIAYLE